MFYYILMYYSKSIRALKNNLVSSRLDYTKSDTRLKFGTIVTLNISWRCKSAEVDNKIYQDVR